MRPAQLHNIYFVIAFYIYIAATGEAVLDGVASTDLGPARMEEIGWGEDARTTPPVDAGSRR